MPDPSTSPVKRQSDEQRCAELRREAGIERLRTLTSGDPDICIALIDGPVFREHPCFEGARIVEVVNQFDLEPESTATAHATCLASMLVGRGERVVSICPDSTLLSFPILDRAFQIGSLSPKAAAERISGAVVQAVACGASVIQLSLEFSSQYDKQFQQVGEALRYAAVRGVNTVVASGNHPTLGACSVLTAPGAVPVGMADLNGMPHPLGALGASIGTRGLLAAGIDIPGAVPPDSYARHAGSSYAVSFVTGTYVLLRSQNPNKHSDSIWEALIRPNGSLRRQYSIVPPRLNGDRALCQTEGHLFSANNNWVLKILKH